MQLADPTLTPGTLQPGVTVAQLATPGYTKTVRPSAFTAARMKLRAMSAYRIRRTPANLLRYTLDHLIALENGGAGGSITDLTNVWPQPKAEAKVKDIQENALHRRIIMGGLTIEDAAAITRKNWTR